MDTETTESRHNLAGIPRQQSLPYYRSHLLPSAAVRELSRLRPWRVFVDVAFCWAMIAATWACVAMFPVWWMVLLAAPIIGSRYYALFVIGHDGMHRRLLKRVRWNDLFNDLFILGAIGAITRINNRNHLDHHLKIGTLRDPDRHKHTCLNKADHHHFISFIFGFGSIWPTLLHVFGRKPKQNEVIHYTPRDLLILFGWQAGLLAGLWAWIGWWAYPLLWLVPVYLFTFLADNVRSFAEHSHPVTDDQADGRRLITYTSNPLERLFFSPMNMNCHAAHHLWPSIPYYNLAKADRQMRPLQNARDLIWRPSYLGYLFNYFLKLPLLECKQPAPSQSS
jgi:fatty acid desaturase